MVKLKPLGDRVLLKTVEAEDRSRGGIIIPDVAKERPLEGEVMAVGPGRMLDCGTLVTSGVKPGDRVIFGKYNGTDIHLDGEKFLIVRAEDIHGVIELN